MPCLRFFYVANVSFNAIRENKILATRMGTIFEVSFAVLKSIVPPEFWTLQMSGVSNIIRIYH